MLSPCGLMDKALASGAKDCGFESHQGRSFGLFFRQQISFFFLSSSQTVNSVGSIIQRAKEN